MKPLLYASIFLLVLFLSKCREECDGRDATSYSDCKNLEVSNGKKCCFSIFSYTESNGNSHDYKTCEEIDDENSAKQRRAAGIDGEVIKNYFDCGQTNDSNDAWNLKIDLFCLLLLLLF